MSFIEALATTARRIAKRGPYYAKAFGLMAGPVLCLRVESRGVRRSPGRLTSVALPGFAGPVWMRDTVADRSIVWQNLVRQHYTLPSPAHDEAVMERYARGVAENRRMLVLDCGGNIGLAAIWYARLFPKATIVTLEPDPENFALLLRNVAPYPNIHAIQGGIWSTSGSMCIANPESGSAAFRLRHAEPGEKADVEVYSVADICRRFDIESPFVVKIDIEGGQAALFAENTDWIAGTDLIAIELDDWLMPFQGTSQAFFRAISQEPFDYLLGGDTLFCCRADQTVERQARPVAPMAMMVSGEPVGAA
mgnify:CR=1 FL=1